MKCFIYALLDAGAPVTTYSFPGEWDHHVRLREPGAAPVYAVQSLLSPCPSCGVLRRGTGPHAPRWRDGVVVDCAGKAVTP